MALTAHQLLHVNALIADIEGVQALPDAERQALADNRNLSLSQFDNYVDRILTAAIGVRDSGVWPSLLTGKRAYEIHDFIENEISG